MQFRRVSKPIRILLLCLALCLTVLAVLITVTVGVLSSIRSQRDDDLIEAASSGAAEEVDVLLSEGANPNAIHWEGYASHWEGSSALYLAVNSGSLPTVRLLLSHGANPNPRGPFSSVLDAALGHVNKADTEGERREAMAILKALLAAGVDTHGVTEPSAVRLLQQAGAIKKQ